MAIARHLASLPRHRSYAKFEDERRQLFAAELAAETIPYLGEMAQVRDDMVPYGTDAEWGCDCDCGVGGVRWGYCTSHTH